MGRSSWWSSLAWPDPQDPPFLNGVVMVRTAHDPHELMAALGRIEDAFGRERSVRNAPRTLDLDLIAYGRLSGELDGLILPHPRAAERRFVMGPIVEIAPLWRHPKVLVSPHTAALNGKEEERIARRFAENATRLLDGQPMRAVVDTVEFY